MATPFIGQISIFAGNFAPRGWAFCNGQILSIAQNTALFSILGTTYGGNGQTTFALPDLRGRVPVSAGVGPGLSPYTLGQMSGSEQVSLIANQLPAHTHTLMGTSNPGTTDNPGNGTLAAGSGVGVYAQGSPANQPLAAGSVGATGGNQPVPTLPPSLTVNYIIALQGIFPSRN